MDKCKPSINPKGASGKKTRSD